MAGKRAAAGQAGPPTKKRRVDQPCVICPADAKKGAYYGIWHEETKRLELKYCSDHFKQLQAQGEDMRHLVTRNQAAVLRNGKPNGACVYDDCNIAANYGVWDHEKKSLSLTLCCGHFNEFQAQGWDLTHVITRTKAAELKHGKPPRSCQYQDCRVKAYYGPYDEDTKIFYAKLCASHYQAVISGSGSEGAGVSLEDVEQYVNVRSAHILQTGRNVGQCCVEDCTLRATFGSLCKRFTATHCAGHSDPASMVSTNDNLRIFFPEQAAAKADWHLQYRKQHALCPGTTDGAACTHSGVKGPSEARCAFCADGLTADRLTPEDYHRKYEAICKLVLKEGMQEELMKKGYVLKEEVSLLNLGFDNIKALSPTARRDMLIADAAVAKVFESNSTATRQFMRSKYKLLAPLHMRDYPGQTKLELLYKLMPVHYKLNLLLLEKAKLLLNNKAIGIFEIDEHGHNSYSRDNELCRVTSAFQQSEGCITTLLKVVPDAHPSQDPVGWPTSPADRLHSALKLLLATMQTAVKDTVIYLYYPPNNKHLSAARKYLVPRTDINLPPPAAPAAACSVQKSSRSVRPRPQRRQQQNQ